MSDAVSYLSEPPTHGKLLLHTTIGDLDVELFSSAAPFACRLFVHLCLRHHFDGLPFHRIVPHFLAQTGDRVLPPLPLTLTSPPAKPELHSRLRFNRRGLLGLASPIHPPSPSSPPTPPSSSQFFITLAPAEELTGQHVLFGKVTGSTVYNLGRLDEVEVVGEVPVHAPRVRGVEVLVEPWEGMREEGGEGGEGGEEEEGGGGGEEEESGRGGEAGEEKCAAVVIRWGGGGGGGGGWGAGRAGGRGRGRAFMRW